MYHKKEITKRMHQEEGPENMNQAALLCEFLKKLTQFVLSIYVLSFLFLHPSWLYFLHSFMPHYDTFPSRLFSLVTDKNYLFILCNGILVFIAKYPCRKIDSQPPPSPVPSPDTDLIFKVYAQALQPSLEKSVLVENVAIEDRNIEKRKSSETKEAILDEETKWGKAELMTIDDGQMKEVHGGNFDDDVEEYVTEEYKSGSSFEEEENEEEEEITKTSTEEVKVHGGSFDDDVEECVKEEYESGSDVEEEENEEEEEITKMSTEELNRKFEDFIRKMKEELRIEAQHLVIKV